MRISVVTISFNQAPFLQRTIDSVLMQEYPDIEYIICDPGSTDGSRDIIEDCRRGFAEVIYAPDRGPADGLNSGFSKATGDIFYYLNSDDVVEPGAFAYAAQFFADHPEVDVMCGHGWLIDEDGHRLRKLWSDPYLRSAAAYSTGIQIQPSTFFRAKAFRKTHGFNSLNKLSWDGELMMEFFLSGARIAVVDAFLSGYRIHNSSITGTGSQEALLNSDRRLRFERLMGRSWRKSDEYMRLINWILRQLRNPVAFLERLTNGPAYKRLKLRRAHPESPQ